MSGAGATGASGRTALVVIVAFAGLLVTVGVVVLTGSSDDSDATSAAAPGACIKAWNEDEAAVGTGYHVAGFHGYTRAWVLYLDEGGDEATAEDGECAVVFPSDQLDAEPEFAVTIKTSDGWLPLYASRNSPVSREHFGGRSPVGAARIAELQRDALSAANAALLPDGSLSQP